MGSRAEDLVARGIGAWGIHDELSRIQEMCADVISSIAWVRRSGADLEQLGQAAGQLVVACEMLRQAAGDEAFGRGILAALDDLEDDVILFEESGVKARGAVAACHNERSER